MSVQLQPRVLEELLQEGRYLYPTGVVPAVERFHPHDGPGVARSVVSAYVLEALRRMGASAPLPPERFERLLDSRVVDETVWLPNALYEVAPGRVSTYPLHWHERLAGERDPVAYVTVIAADLASVRGTGTAGPPAVPKALLVDAMTVLGRMERSTANGLVTDARLAGRLSVQPFQNPEAEVRVVPGRAPPPGPRRGWRDTVDRLRDVRV